MQQITQELELLLPQLHGIWLLGRARKRDDAASIDDSGIGLAAADLARCRNAEALRTAREVRAELIRRDAAMAARARGAAG
ncbi:MAG: hypothetical protein K2X46_14460 [Roseomonas sp.]|nr:hypothetical protein [Roseomonas sp.]